MKKIKMLFMDVDGTLTDGKIYIGQDGELFKAFNIKDGYGVRNILGAHNIIPIVITARESRIVQNRCDELNIKYLYQGCKDKLLLMRELAADNEIIEKDNILEGVAYIGDDIVDLPCIMIAQYSGCPADAVDSIKKNVSFISKYNGGDGAVRDFIEWLVNDENT